MTAPQEIPHARARLPVGRLPAPLLLAAAALFWSGNFVVGRAVNTRVPPVALSFWRWVVCLAALLPFTHRKVRAQWPLLRREWAMLTLLGILGVGNFSMMVYLGLHRTTATNGALLQSACPAFIVGISFAIGAGRPTGRQIAGIALSLAGVLAIVTRGAPAALLSLTFDRGDLWVLGAVVNWALYTILVARDPGDLDPVVRLVALAVTGIVWMAPFYAWEMVHGAYMTLDGPTVLAVLYVAIPASLVAFVAWNEGVGAIGASRAGVYLHLMPAFASVLAVVLLGESFRWFHLAGIAFILAGVSLAGRVRLATA